MQELPNDPSASEGECLIELLNAGGGVVSSTYVDPGVEDLVVREGDGGPPTRLRRKSGFAAHLFGASLPWSSEARALRIRCGGPVLLEETFSPNPPVVAFDNLDDGDVLSGVVTLSWTGSDVDGPDLYYQLQTRDDDDGIWGPLTPLTRSTGIELDSRNLPATSDGLLRIMVTDGFNTAYDSKEVGIRNHLQVVGADPADGYGVTFVPAHPLEPSTSYTVILGTGIEDLEGNRLEETFSWSFTTEVDGAPPSVIATSPADSDLEVPRNALIQAERQVCSFWSRSSPSPHLRLHGGGGERPAIPGESPPVKPLAWTFGRGGPG